MAHRFEDERIDRLYQLNPSEFTRERNALAKEMRGEEGKRVRALQKPSVAAWAVNQLYWRDRKTFDDLVATSERLRMAHRAVLGGRKADLSGVDAAHREAVKRALMTALRMARDARQNISPATHTEIAQTLESLSSNDAAGRLAQPLRPGGFETLRGMPIKAAKEEQSRITVIPLKADKPLKRETLTHDNAAQAREQETSRHALRAARSVEHRDRTAVARLRKQLSQAERTAGAAETALTRAREKETRLRTELRRAEERLQQSTEALATIRSRAQRRP